MPRVGPDKYPRTCKGLAGPHLIVGPEDEYDGRCRSCRVAKSIRYFQTPKGKMAKAKADQKWAQSPLGKTSQRTVKQRHKKTPKGQASEARYLASPVGRQTAVRKAQRYRARKRAVLSEPYSVADVYAKTGGLCYYDDTHIATTIDHVVPISRGGQDTFENVVPACKSCNSRKADKMPEEWLNHA